VRSGARNCCPPVAYSHKLLKMSDPDVMGLRRMRWLRLWKEYSSIKLAAVAFAAAAVLASTALLIIQLGVDAELDLRLTLFTIGLFVFAFVLFWFASDAVYLYVLKRRAREEREIFDLRRELKHETRDLFFQLDRLERLDLNFLDEEKYQSDSEIQEQAREVRRLQEGLESEGNHMFGDLVRLERDLARQNGALRGNRLRQERRWKARELRGRRIKFRSRLTQLEWKARDLRDRGTLNLHDDPLAYEYHERRPPKPEGAKEVQEVMFTTNRLVQENQQLCISAITDRRSPNQTFGRAWVSVPRGHKIGIVERPKFDWLRMRPQRERAEKHFILLDLLKMTDDEFFTDLRLNTDDSVLVFVHGYSTSFQDAVLKTAQIAFDANFPGKVVAFSWPSSGAFTGYDYDRESALASASSLLMLLRRTKVENLFLVAHSLGSQIVIDALQMASLSGDDLNLREVVFAAPDVDKDVFMSRAELIKKIAGGVTLYASSADKALMFSKAKAGGVARAGDMPKGTPLLLAGIDLIDVTALGEDMFALNHGTFARDRSVLDDLGRIVTTQTRPPHVRTPTLQRMPNRLLTRYWMYPP
jgi:esterase/lipase superfamily enzyme